MKPPPFDYYAPQSVEEVLSLLEQYGANAKVLAGGQSLMPLLNLRLAAPSILIDLNRVDSLSYLRQENGDLVIGAMTRQRALEREETVAQKLPLLHAAAEWIGHWQIRNRGTVGGSLVHADPAAELPALASALEASFILTSPGGQTRTLTPDDFFITNLTTAIEPDELLTEIRFPIPPSQTGWSIVEIARRHGDFALVGVVAIVTLDETGRCADTRLSLFGVGETPMRATSAERVLTGQKPEEEAIRAAAAEVTQDIDTSGDLHASAEYRKEVAIVLVRRALTQAMSRAH